MTKPTPGPWAIVNSTSVAKSNNPTRILADCYLGCDSGERFMEAVANAHLISAAPDLLGAAYAALKLIKGAGFSENTLALIELKAALNKAEGR